MAPLETVKQSTGALLRLYPEIFIERNRYEAAWGYLDTKGSLTYTPAHSK